MAELKDKVQNALQEGRILILGAQVLLGFQYRSIFESGFESLPAHAQYLKLAGLLLMVIAVGLLMWPGAYHNIVEQGEDTRSMHRFTSRVMSFALLPFALGLGIDYFIATEKLAGFAAAVAGGVVALLLALSFWYGLEFVQRINRSPRIKERQAMEKEKSKKSNESDSEGSKVKDKIKHVLTEARVVLPGAQALLGFQFATMLTEGFDKLPASSKYIHLASVALIGLTIILLITPAAYHRMVEEGEETEHFHTVASRIVVAAMIPLALGITGDLFVVFRKVTESVSFALIISAAMLSLFYGFWFGFTLYRRSQRPDQRSASRMPEKRVA